MAVASDSILSRTLPKISPSFSFSFKTQISATPVNLARGFSCNGRNLKFKCEIKAEVQAEVVLQEKSLQGLSLGFDVVSEGELREKGFMGMRKTKMVCTIGPACCSEEALEKLALGGMNVARLNMCHNSREWHLDVIRKIKRLNDEKGFCVAVMIDTEGSQIHVVDHGAPSSVKAEVFNKNPTSWFGLVSLAV